MSWLRGRRGSRRGDRRGGRRGGGCRAEGLSEGLLEKLLRNGGAKDDERGGSWGETVEEVVGGGVGEAVGGGRGERGGGGLSEGCPKGEPQQMHEAEMGEAYWEALSEAVRMWDSAKAVSEAVVRRVARAMHERLFTFPMKSNNYGEGGVRAPF
ncbi:hypothetical protein BDZ91DRAFT_802547 [Kalaharituber pfeilii]|nr:hypothetical protein BDZ91DRAFT_802547 [Kalaharituber pfeilii]